MTEFNGDERRDPHNRLTNSQVRVLVDLIESGKLEHLLEIEEKDKKMKWLMASIRNASVWIAAVITSIYLGYGAVADTLKSMVGK